jgi:hypothetical protein
VVGRYSVDGHVVPELVLQYVGAVVSELANVVEATGKQFYVV